MDKKLNITKNTKIYVACSANVVTGGPELLHQLVHQLNQLGLNAYIHYYYYEDNKKGSKDPTDEAYKKYNNPVIEKIQDNKNNIYIVPEVKTNLLQEFNNIQKVIWWLSVDNYYTRFKSEVKLKQIIKYLLYYLNYYNVYKFKDSSIINFVQSEYAKQHLVSKGIKNSSYLSDYLNEIFISKQLKNIDINKKDIVLYNPKKGINFTHKIMNYAQNIQFIPIQNMTREEVSKLLSSAKVYIDFGNHPGKDRIPREAAISGCCVITNKKGSAKFYKDVPIEEEYKFDDIDNNIPTIVNKINECLENFEEKTKDFNNYREIIQHEQKVFINDIKKYFR